MKLILTTKITSIATMLSTNVLCIKTRRKRSYYVSEASDYIPRPSKDKRSLNATPGMMQITEDTPPDMLAGAMDLTVHLPTETTVKMSVDRSTPMMDLLVQITTAHHLQQSGHILQALEMAPSSGRLDKILPYKPNTPIGVLDTQHVKVIPKNRSIPVPKSVSGGHQPFESTFRLQVHLPRNQLYVIRVSQNVYLEDIMKKVCHEKNLDSSKFEFRHPANLDEVLNPKLTLSDYQITEVYVVFKGTIGLTQPFSANDIMTSRKEEERKQMQARTGGGVLSLIFKRGKQSMGSGSISSENRSISPSHSDDSRSVTPPAIQQPLLSSRIQPAAVLKEKPKAPQRKRRPAPKPPQSTDHKNDVIDKAPSEISSISESNTIDSKKLDNGLTICHSRNSSDSSGYHEPSVLSDNCNTSLPKRSKSTLINEVLNEESQYEETVSVRSQNLTTMSNFSKSTSSIAGRKKKAAPPPPPTLKSEDISSSSETVTVSIASDKTDNTETESAVAETVPKSVETESLDDIAVDVTKTSPVPMRRKKLVRAPPKPSPRVKSVTVDMPIPQARNPSISKEDKLQLNAEENYNNVLNEASSNTANKSINNDSNIKNNLTSKINHLQLTNDGEAALSKSILQKDKKLIDLELEEPSASTTFKQDEKGLVNEDPVHIKRLNSNKSNIDDLVPYKSQDSKEPTLTQEKQSPTEVCDFESAELEVLLLRKSLDEKLNLVKCLPEQTESKDKPDVEISSEISSGEFDLLEICDLALKEIEMSRDNSHDNITEKTTNNDDLILLGVSDSKVSKKDSIHADKNENPVPMQRTRTKKCKIIPNNVSSENNFIDQDLPSTNNDQINNNQLVDAAAEVSKYFEDFNSNYKEIGTNRKESIANASLSFESIGENVSITDDNDKVNNAQLVDVTLEVVKSSEGVICDNKNTGTNNNESVTSASLSVNCIDVEQSTINDIVQVNNNQIVDVISEVATSSDNEPSKTSLERRASKSGSLSSDLSSLDLTKRVTEINIGSSTVAMNEEDNSSIVSSKTENKNLDNISVTSNCSLNEDIDVFEASGIMQNKKSFKNLKSIDSQTTCKRIGEANLHGESNSKEWNGARKLNNISTNVDLDDSTWTVGDHSETESAEVRQRVISSSNKNIEPLKRSSISSTTSLKSSNSEVIELEISNEVVNANLNCDSDRNTAITPKNVTELESRNSKVNLDQKCEARVLKENHNNIKDLESQIISNCSPKSSVSVKAPKIKEESSKSEEAKNQVIVKPNVEELDDLDHEWQYQLPSPPKAFRDSSPTNLTDLTNYDTITLQDFKENSILSHTELFEKLGKIKDSQYENESISDFSSVCNDEDKPILSKLTLENLEKRQSLVYNRELSTSLKNAQENNFTSQINQTRSIDDTNIKRSSVVNELEKVIKSNKPLVRHNSCIADTTLKPFVDNNLPNFKISTYDTFKRKINIFEDESIRSNSDNSFKPVTYNEISNSKSMPYESVSCFSNKSPMRSQNLSIAKSIENLSIVNIDCDEVDFKKPSEYSKHNSNSKTSFYVKHKSSTLNSAGRSESFSANKWIPQNPVQRSKSQIALNKFTEIEQDITFEDPSTLTKSNSLFDVSGLQSLEVIRSIQNKLNTPNNSTEDLLDHKEESKQSSARSSISLDQDSAPIAEKSSNETTNTKTYRYQGPPSINLSTWSERPRTKVSLKEDTDYKIKNVENGKVKTPITTTGEQQANSTRRFGDSNSCTIQINGTEPIRSNQDSGNVTIKVGSNQFSKQFSRINKFMQNMENPFVRKPLGNINKIEANSRPHSLPQDSDFDISRVPIVRAVELKKSIKETTPVNTSVTQINALNNEITNNNKYSDIYQSTERLQEINGLKNQTTKSSVYLTSENTHKPITRGNSFAYSRNVPKVMGFTDIKIENDNTPRSRKSWNVPSNYEPLPLKIKPEPPVRSSSFLPNSNVPFSNLTLKRVESKKPDSSANNNIYGNVVLRNTTSQFKCDEINQDVPNNEKPKQFPPIRRISNGAHPVPPCLPPFKPIVPKKIVKRTESCADPRDELLNSIRNFGGQKGLRHVKAV